MVDLEDLFPDEDLFQEIDDSGDIYWDNPEEIEESYI